MDYHRSYTDGKDRKKSGRLQTDYQKFNIFFVFTKKKRNQEHGVHLYNKASKSQLFLILRKHALQNNIGKTDDIDCRGSKKHTESPTIHFKKSEALKIDGYHGCEKPH